MYRHSLGKDFHTEWDLQDFLQPSRLFWIENPSTRRQLVELDWGHAFYIRQGRT